MIPAELEALGFDDERENLRCLVRVETSREGPYRAWLARSLPPALEGKLRMNLGEPEAALPLLAERAAGLPVGSWRGQCLLLLGRFAEAREALAGAASEAAAYPWARFYAAAASLALGDLAAARRESAAFSRALPGAAALALSALVSAASDRRAEAREALARAAGLRPRETWPLALASALAQSGGEYALAREALEEALRRRPSAWLHAELARVFERLGILPSALASAAAAIALEPSVDHHRLKAGLHVCWREYEHADAELTSALLLSPDPGLHFERSKVRSAWGRLDAAAEDAGAALAAGPEDLDLAAWAAQLQILLGRYAKAAKALAALAAREKRSGGARASFLAAYLDFHAGRRRQAARSFAACARKAEGALALKAGFYATAAAALSGGKPARKAELLLLGLGVNPPYSATAEALRAIASCDVVFNNIMGDELFELLRPLCRDCRPVAYHQNGDEGVLSDEMLAEVRKGRVVGFVTRGNALVYGPLGAEMARRADERGASWRCAAAVSSQELLSAKFGAEGAGPGQGVLDAAAAERGGLLDPALPLTLYLNLRSSPQEFARLCRELERVYGAERLCLVLDHVIGQEPWRVALSALEGLRARLSPSALVYVPARGKA